MIAAKLLSASGHAVTILSQSVDNYLKAIYELEEAEGRVATNQLAEKLAIAAPSVTAMIKRLHEHEPALVSYTRHKGVKLTEHGRQRAIEMVRHHRLLETFLYEVLGYAWDEVHEDAAQLEHHISERLEERIAQYLGHPAFDPHGAPIPTRDGQLPKIAYLPLSELPSGQPARVLRIKNAEPERLRYLYGLGIEPGAVVSVESKAPFDGPYHVRVGDGGAPATHGIGPSVADIVLVEPIPAEAAGP